MKAFFNIMMIILILSLTGCEDFVDVDLPRTELIRHNVFKDSQTAEATILGLYSQMLQSGAASGDLMSINLLCSLSSDELINYNTSGISEELEQFNSNGLFPNNSLIERLWSESYRYIYQANSIMEGLEDLSTGISQSVRDQLRGEALFIRALFHFYLVELFGDVPLVLSTNYQINATVVRRSKGEIYNQIITDLVDSKGHLIPDNSFGNDERIRPNRWAATALLARANLFNGNWQAAAQEATEVIVSGRYSLAEMETAFLKNNTEAIWQLGSATRNTNEAAIFISSGTPKNIAITASMIGGFFEGDQRIAQWIGTTTDGENTWHFPFKYKDIGRGTITEYSTVLRLAEQYLIRAEARTQLEDLPGAIEDLNKVRQRAGLPNIMTNSKESLLDSILMERKREFFTEWGHRWLDLKRTGKIDQIMQLEKPGRWKSTAALYPIPEVQLQNNPNMKDQQNLGY